MINGINNILAKLGNKQAKEKLKLRRASDLYAKALREFQKESKYLEGTDGRLTLPKAEYTAEDAENARRDLDEAFERGEITEEELATAMDEIDSALEESEGHAAALAERTQRKQHSVSEDGRLKLPKVEADQVIHTDTASYSISPTLQSDLEKVLAGTFKSETDEVYVGETSNFLTEVIGAKALRMTMPADKAYAAMVDEKRAKTERRYKKKYNYHNLGVKGLIEAIKASENPVAAFEGKNGETGELNGNIVLVTDMEYAGNNIVVVEALDSSSILSGKRIKANKVVTSYDKKSLAEAIEEAERKERLLYLDKKRSQNLAGVPAAFPQAAIQEVDFKKNIQNFWMDVKWIRSGNTKYSSGPSDDGESAIAHAFKNPGKLRTKSNRSYSVSEETDGKLHLPKVEPVEETARDTASGETDGGLRLPRVRQEEKQDNGVDFGEGVRYNEIKNEGGGNNGREMDHSGVRGRFEMANSGERTAEGAGGGGVFETSGKQAGIRVHSGRSGRAIYTEDSEGRRVNNEQAIEPMTEKLVTIYIDDYPRRCEESKVDQVLAHIEKLKQYYLKKGVPQEMLDKMYHVRIVKDE